MNLGYNSRSENILNQTFSLLKKKEKKTSYIIVCFFFLHGVQNLLFIDNWRARDYSLFFVFIL